MTSLTINLPDDVKPEQAQQIADIILDAVVKLQHRGLTMASIVPLLRLTAIALEDADHDPIQSLRSKALDYALIEVAVPELMESEDEADLLSAIGELAEIKALERFERRIPELDWDQESWGSMDLEALFNKVMEGIEIYGSALRAAEKLAEECDYPIIMNREAWRASATDDELDHEDDLLFFDEIYQLANPMELRRLVDYVVIGAGIHRRSQLLDQIKECCQAVFENVRVEKSIIDDVIDAVRRYPALSREFDEIASGKTVPATDFIASLKMPHHLTTAWLEEAVEDGRIAKVKKGRWLLVSAANKL